MVLSEAICFRQLQGYGFRMLDGVSLSWLTLPAE